MGLTLLLAGVFAIVRLNSDAVEETISVTPLAEVDA
jgi:hypothetical protein